MVLLLGSSRAMGEGDIVGQSRELMEQAHQESNAAMNAAAEGDRPAYEQHVARVQDLYSQVASLFESVDAADSENTEVLVAYADFLRERGDYDLAEETLIRAASRAPNNAEIWLALGEVQGLYEPKEGERAIRSLRTALSLNASPELNAKIHAALGAQFMQDGLHEFARRSLEAALEEDSSHVGARIALASLDVRDGQIAKASDSLDALGELSPQSLSLMQRTMDQALVDFEESRRWMPDTAENHLAYGKLLVRAGRAADSVWPLERSVQLDPANYVTWNLLGSVYRGLNRPEMAREAFSRSLKINPDQPRTQAALDELDGASASPPMEDSTAPEAGTE